MKAEVGMKYTEACRDYSVDINWYANQSWIWLILRFSFKRMWESSLGCGITQPTKDIHSVLSHQEDAEVMDTVQLLMAHLWTDGLMLLTDGGIYI